MSVRAAATRASASSAGGFEAGEFRREELRAHVARLLLLGEGGEFGAEGGDLSLDLPGGALGVLEGGFRLRAAGAGFAHEGVLIGRGVRGLPLAARRSARSSSAAACISSSCVRRRSSAPASSAS